MALAGTQATNQALNGLDASGTPTNLLAFVQLHTATPGTTGTSEMASVTRLACAWNAASAGSKTNSSALSFTTPGTVPATHFGGWSAVTVGTFGMGGALASPVTAATITVAAGALTLSAA